MTEHDEDDPLAWRVFAACRGIPNAGGVFFPDNGDYTAAAKVCAGCPVQDPCALAGRHEHGWWGGQPGGREAMLDLLPGVPRRRHLTHISP